MNVPQHLALALIVVASVGLGWSAKLVPQHIAGTACEIEWNSLVARQKQKLNINDETDWLVDLQDDGVVALGKGSKNTFWARFDCDSNNNLVHKYCRLGSELTNEPLSKGLLKIPVTKFYYARDEDRYNYACVESKPDDVTAAVFPDDYSIFDPKRLKVTQCRRLGQGGICGAPADMEPCLPLWSELQKAKGVRNGGIEYLKQSDDLKRQMVSLTFSCDREAKKLKLSLCIIDYRPELTTRPGTYCRWGDYLYACPKADTPVDQLTAAIHRVPSTDLSNSHLAGLEKCIPAIMKGCAEKWLALIDDGKRISHEDGSVKLQHAAYTGSSSAAPTPEKWGRFTCQKGNLKLEECLSTAGNGILHKVDVGNCPAVV